MTERLPPRRIAIVLFNLGGPDKLSAVRPFLFNLFKDRAIINLPAIARYPLAALISSTRNKMAQANYARMGGFSPLTPETRAQSAALKVRLTEGSDDVIEVFTAMRYWAPDSDEAAKAVKAFGPDEILLLPLYPQYSTTTTRSSTMAWAKAYDGPGRVRSICCYPVDAGLVAAQAERIETAWDAAGRPENVRLLFSAHGLPLQVIEQGDPYQAQIEATAAAVAGRLSRIWDWRVCYQSKVGPLPWLGPTTTQEIETASEEGLGVVVVPIAFVSEHVETLVELDHDYAGFAANVGSPHYVRVPALGVQSLFIDGLAKLVAERLDDAAPGVKAGSAYVCPGKWRGCPNLSRETAA